MKIESISRQIYKSDFDRTGSIERSDGSLEIRCESVVLSFEAHTESETVFLRYRQAKRFGSSYQTIDMAVDDKWKELIGREIDGIQPMPHGFNVFVGELAISVFYYSADDFIDCVFVRLNKGARFFWIDDRRGRPDYEP